ncbi:peritrophin-1-like [Anopheles cruzii]|uniref:peritrophin-1-like n=1 Tax=Anopheles cruzii TaxID=68878 RepID=UPI0022EC6132|nr:peritrophin-1-like [Anopheles cruzii]
MKVSVFIGVCVVLFAPNALAEGRCPPRDDPLLPPVLLPHPTDCDKFVICSHGFEVTSKCPPGLEWNDRRKQCDYPSEAQCVPQDGSSSTVIAATADGCPPVYDPDHMVYIAHAIDCTKYYICDPYGVPLQQDCPPGLHWNPRVDYCDFPELASCKVA